MDELISNTKTDEHLNFVADALREAATNAHEELLRRGVSNEDALGAVILTFICLGVQFSHDVHVKSRLRAVSLESLHKNVDKLWAACDEDDRLTKD